MYYNMLYEVILQNFTQRLKIWKYIAAIGFYVVLWKNKFFLKICCLIKVKVTKMKMRNLRAFPLLGHKQVPFPYHPHRWVQLWYFMSLPAVHSDGSYLVSWIAGSLHPNFQIFILQLEMDTYIVKVAAGLSLFGSPGGHCSRHLSPVVRIQPDMKIIATWHCQPCCET